jgi:signal transduction histidine kinase
MSYVGRAGSWRGGRSESGRRLAASPQAAAVAGALLGLAAVTEALVRATHAGYGALGLVAVFLLALSTTAPLAFLGPAAAAVAISAASVLSLAVIQTMTVAGLCAQLIVLYCLGLKELPRSGAVRNDGAQPAEKRQIMAQLLAPGLGLPFTVIALVQARPAGPEERVLTVLLAALAPAAALAGIARRARIQAQADSTARQVIADSLFEHMARGERARIARELHDVVAHHISMIAVQAETARLATPGMPPAGAQRLLEIGNTARAGLTEMRRLLGVLREDAHVAHLGEIGADRQPQPGLQQLSGLIDEAREASGTGARFIVSGPPVTLDPGVELAAYRIVQEALTNTRRHAPGAAVDVELHFTDDALRLRIRDNGPGPPPGPADSGDPAAPAAPAAGGGHGLPGMRERAAAAGGELRTGTAPGGGFLIEAALPAKAEVRR